MKKNQNKSKFEERKSVANQCDYSRSNGKCGRAMCEHFGKLCPGRSCEDWSCDAEGEEAKWFCDELRCNGTCGNGKSDNFNKKCRGENCPDLIPTPATAVTVVEPSGGAVGMTDQDVAAGITRQLQVIEDAEKNAQLERVKLGVVLIRWEQYLGDSRGRGKAGGGLKGWLEKNVPALSYKTAQSYKDQAKQAVKMLGGGAKAQAVLLDEPTVTQPDGEVIEIEAEYVAKRDKLFEDVKSRRQLEQTYFKFMASEGRRGPGRPKGTKADLSRKPDSKDVEASARAVWSQVIVPADRSAVALKSAAKLLTLEDVENAKAVLASLMEMLKEREEELKN